ncbi:hypothetical protein DSCA_40140 [Desulfosarcina alkanivorans]|uniref:Uncharacterized protein n=1 Tax=Desulfosarcina alkanivorans TaxID=571177 RepID=A0A5K7YUV2_9BACT|nr:hypothetical protein DSCA_40140 [Desulfosarcina alkanivorans]
MGPEGFPGAQGMGQRQSFLIGAHGGGSFFGFVPIPVYYGHEVRGLSILSARIINRMGCR